MNVLAEKDLNSTGKTSASISMNAPQVFMCAARTPSARISLEATLASVLAEAELVQKPAMLGTNVALTLPEQRLAST